MSWFNYYGLAIIAVILLPNIIFAYKCKEKFVNLYANKAVVCLEEIGRYGSMLFMIFNIPYTYCGFWFDNALIVYLSVNGALCLAYLIGWLVLWNRENKLKALLLSILPSAVFIFSGVMLTSVTLFVFAVIFAINHILISWKNYAIRNARADI